MSLIKIENQLIQFSQKLLGTDEAWVWVGSGYSPMDNNDERVKETRALMEKYYNFVPYGMWVGNKKEETAVPLILENAYYTLDTSWWPVGVYRLNLHTNAGQESPYGSKLRPEKRDLDCSWAPIDSEQWTEEEKESLRPFLHKEENGAGSSLRILIRPDHTIEALGDSIK